MLMLVGMVTVFIILIIVIEGGKLLIRCVNSLAPAQEPKPVKNGAPAVSAEAKAVIEAAVASLTGGKGRVTGIEKIA